LPLLGFSKHSSGTLQYWYRPASPQVMSQTSPVVFCHGLGVGVLPYIPFLRKLISLGHAAEIFCVELPHISMQIKREVPSAPEVVTNIRDMLAAWDVSRAHFIGHSFGSVVLAWVTRQRPDLISKATFIDPVVFLLCKSDVAYNFIYRVPSNAFEHVMQYFVSRELYIAHSLSRNLFWHESILWTEDLQYPGGTLVVLSGCDSIVPAHSVRRYLQCARHSSQPEVLFFAEMGHAAFLLHPDAIEQIITQAFK